MYNYAFIKAFGLQKENWESYENLFNEMLLMLKATGYDKDYQLLKAMLQIVHSESTN